MDSKFDPQTLETNIYTICEGEPDLIAVMASCVCEIHQSDSRFHWTGFYRVVAPALLKIGPYQGSHGCLSIPFSRGVCGAAARSGEIQIVDDVEAFEGHIACSSTTKSELVIPVYNHDDDLIAVLDIDSDFPAAFTQEDALHLDRMLRRVFAQRRE